MLRKPAEGARREQLMAELRRGREARESSYRAQALQLFPHVCGRCGREFSGKRLRELTVHHKDHNYHNNPPDGSNWELLCLYCHDDEHEKEKKAGYATGAAAERDSTSPGFSPFSALDRLLDKKDEGDRK